MKNKLSKLVNAYQKYDLKTFLHKCAGYIRSRYFDRINLGTILNAQKRRCEIVEVLRGEYDRVILWRSTLGYRTELLQRPQHIFDSLADQGCLVFYEVNTMTDGVKELCKEKENMYLFNFNNMKLNHILMEELSRVEKPKFIDFFSTDYNLSVNDVERYMKQGFGVIYEYIDHISAEIAGMTEIPKNIIEKYQFAMGNEDVFVIATADKLLGDVISKRGNRNLALSTNGVDYSFFREIGEYKFEPEFARLIGDDKQVLCYYGVIAQWFDYKILRMLNDSGKYNILLFGLKYDDSFEKNRVGDMKNVHFMGPRDYSVLKYYASKADVMMIPFLINDITAATNPVKLFEYMALHKPIVTTDMIECRKYKSVLVASDAEDFMRKVEKAIKLADDENYIELLDREARENDWSAKAKAMINLIS